METLQHLMHTKLVHGRILVICRRRLYDLDVLRILRQIDVTGISVTSEPRSSTQEIINDQGFNTKSSSPQVNL